MKDFSEKYQWQAFALLTALGTIINCFPFPLHYRVDVLFGGIFGLLAICIIPGFKGIFAAAIISIPSYYLWNHPLGILLYTCEALLLMVMLQKTRFHLVFSAMLIWIFVLPPIFWSLMNLTGWFFPSAIRLFTLKYALNGIFNAAVASLLMTFMNLRILQKPDSMGESRISEVAVNLMLIMTIIPLLIFMVLDSRLITSSILTRVESRHRDKHNSIKATIKQWHEQRHKTLTSVAKMHLSRQSITKTDRQNLQFFINNQIDFDSIKIFNNRGKLIQSAKRNSHSDIFTNQIISDIKTSEAAGLKASKKHRELIETGIPVFINNTFSGYASG